jgi:short-subunit dehydrogenase
VTRKPAGSHPPNIIILGASSAIAEAAARTWANQGAHLLLAARGAARLDDVAADLRTRGAVVDTVAVDLAVVDAEQAFAEMVQRLEGVDVVLVTYGLLGDQKLAESNPAEAQRLLATNFASATGWCLAAANVLEKQRYGTLVVIGSVAGDRGRASNYVYGAAKGGLGILVQGLAHRLARTGARAVVIKPGFVDTPMTAHIAGKGFLWAQPETIANVIVKAARPGSRWRPIVYAPSFWRWIMILICMMPSAIFHKTKL